MIWEIYVILNDILYDNMIWSDIIYYYFLFSFYNTYVIYVYCWNQRIKFDPL